jgi:hypothetical protein
MKIWACCTSPSSTRKRLQDEDERIAREIDGDRTGQVDAAKARRDYIHAVAAEGAAGAAE